MNMLRLEGGIICKKVGSHSSRFFLFICFLFFFSSFQEVNDAAAAVEDIVGAHERTGITSPGSFTSTLPSQSSGETTLTMG